MKARVQLKNTILALLDRVLSKVLPIFLHGLSVNDRDMATIVLEGSHVVLVLVPVGLDYVPDFKYFL